MPLFNLEPVNLISSQFIQLLGKKPTTASGGFSSYQAWTTREINTILNDDTNSVILSANTFILPAGSYVIDTKSNFYVVNAVKMRLKNITDGNVLLNGIAAYFSRNSAAYGNAEISGKFVIASNQALTLEYYADNPNINQYNLGAPVGDGSDEIYTTIDLKKVG